MRICKEIEVLLDRHQVLIEGIEFPFHLREAPTVEVEQDAICWVTLTVAADSAYFNQSHQRHRLNEVDRVWCQSTLHNIVEESLADTLAWLRAAGRPV